MRAMILRTWEVQEANRWSACSIMNSPWSNLPKWWGSPTRVHSTSGRMYQWLGVWRWIIGQLAEGGINWKSFRMDHLTGRRRVPIVWWHSWTGCLWLTSIMVNGFGGRGLRCGWRNVYAKFGWWGKREDMATCDRHQIWASPTAKWWEVISPSCYLQRLWLWFAGCRMARILF